MVSYDSLDKIDAFMVLGLIQIYSFGLVTTLYQAWGTLCVLQVIYYQDNFKWKKKINCVWSLPQMQKAVYKYIFHLINLHSNKFNL